MLPLLASGLRNKEIAERVNRSIRTVDHHVQAIFAKLRLPDSEDDNRRVLAVLALLGR